MKKQKLETKSEKLCRYVEMWLAGIVIVFFSSLALRVIAFMWGIML